MFRRPFFVALFAVVVAAALPAATAAQAARPTKPAIKAVEVGYFGNANVAHTIVVFVYTRSQPNRTRVTVCHNGVCERAHGHSAKVAWYSASFKTSPLPMGAPVTFSAVASNSMGKARTRVTQGLLCMHNNGSTPQAS
jgi:hypothetical protein